MTWWEKTVEYLFVAKYFADNIMLAPLDGNEERLSDTILAKDNRWLAIEFKRNEEHRKREEKKFINYEIAKIKFFDRDAHHLIIYGAFEEKLTLKCKTYFSNNFVEIEYALTCGLNPLYFKQYLEEFLKFKKTPKDGDGDGGGGGGLSFEDYKLVACVTNDGELLSCLSISEFLDLFRDEPVKVVHDKEMAAGR